MMKKKNISFAAVAIFILLAVIFLVTGGEEEKSPVSKAAANNSGHLIVHFIDVGQGDCAFIQLPNKKCMLIDAGEADYADLITDKITSLGYDKIDYVVATHPHADHIGAMAEVIDNFSVGDVYMPRVSADTKTFENLLRTIADKGLKIKTVRSGVEIDTSDSGLKMKFLSPSADKYDDLNNYSAVMKLTYGTTSFLFTGDAEKLVENELLESSYDALDADVLKAGHHGSRYSSSKAFLEAVSPDYVVIECSNDNSYGHPHKETLERLNNVGASILRTDKMGDITFESDGSSIEVK